MQALLHTVIGHSCILFCEATIQVFCLFLKKMLVILILLTIFPFINRNIPPITLSQRGIIRNELICAAETHRLFQGPLFYTGAPLLEGVQLLRDGTCQESLWH